MEMALADLRIERFLVFAWLHAANDPSDVEWDAAFDRLALVRRREGVPFSEVRSLVISDGGAPGGVHRSRLGRDFPVQSSVITSVLSSPVKRGIATALSWVNPRFFFGAPKDALRALEHLDLTGQWSRLGPVFAELQEELPPNQTLARVVAELSKRR
jgi:hypothetical protein